MGYKKKIIKLFLLESIVIALVAFVFGSLLFISPFYGDLNFIDEGQFGAWANHMLLGKYMYKDIYIPYGPLLVYPLFILFKLFTPSAFLIRTYLTIGALISVLTINVLMYVAKIQTTVRRILLLFLILIPGLSFRQGSGYLVILFITLSLFYNNKIFYLITGVFSIISFLISPDIGLFSIMLPAAIIVCKLFSAKSTRYELVNWIYFALGISLTIIGFVYWSVNEGWFFSYLDTTFDVLTSFSGVNTPNGKNFPFIAELIESNISFSNFSAFIISKEGFLYWVLTFYMGTFFYLFTRFVLLMSDKQDKIIGLLLLYGVSLYVVVIGRPGHLFFVIHPVIIISILLISKLLSVLENNKEAGRFYSLFILAFLYAFHIRMFLMLRPSFAKIFLAPSALFRQSANPSRLGYIEITSSQKNYINHVQDFVKKNTTKKDYVFFLSDEPMMYLLTDRINPTRYDLPFIANTIQKRYELTYDLQRHRPKFIFYNTKTWAVDEINNFNRIPEIKNILNTSYTKELLAKDIFVYRIK